MNPKHRRFLQWLWRDWIRPCGLVILFLCAARSSLADWNDVPSGSMRPTIVEGDRIWVNKLAFDLKVPFTTWHLAEWSAPSRGDIVVLFSPYDGTRLVKRVIGLPEDVIEVKAGRLHVNNDPVDYAPVFTSASTTELQFTEQLPGHPHQMQFQANRPLARDFGPLKVPADRYFIMGDNRDDSLDSRFIGTVERRRIVGRVSGVVASFDHGHWLKPVWERWFTRLE